jgi:hypothetical protein
LSFIPHRSAGFKAGEIDEAGEGIMARTSEIALLGQMAHMIALCAKIETHSARSRKKQCKIAGWRTKSCKWPRECQSIPIER